MAGLRRAVKSRIPTSLLVARRRWLMKRTATRFRGASNADIFSTVYEQRHWGADSDGGLSSGDGSRDAELVEPYVTAVRGFLESLETPPDVVDLGCGDFNVGRQLRPACGSYVACDVVPAVIERNRKLYGALDVDFRTVDIARDPLPAGEVVMIRQVLQHLANADIALVVPKLGAYRYAVVTDHQPAGRFEPNVDIPTGPHIRVGIGSGLDLSRPPFELTYLQAQEMCVVPDADGVLRTTLYRFR